MAKKITVEKSPQARQVGGNDNSINIIGISDGELIKILENVPGMFEKILTLLVKIDKKNNTQTKKLNEILRILKNLEKFDSEEILKKLSEVQVSLDELATEVNAIRSGVVDLKKDTKEIKKLLEKFNTDEIIANVIAGVKKVLTNVPRRQWLAEKFTEILHTLTDLEASVKEDINTAKRAMIRSIEKAIKEQHEITKHTIIAALESTQKTTQNSIRRYCNALKTNLEQITERLKSIQAQETKIKNALARLQKNSNTINESQENILRTLEEIEMLIDSQDNELVIDYLDTILQTAEEIVTDIKSAARNTRAHVTRKTKEILDAINNLYLSIEKLPTLKQIDATVAKDGDATRKLIAREIEKTNEQIAAFKRTAGRKQKETSDFLEQIQRSLTSVDETLKEINDVVKKDKTDITKIKSLLTTLDRLLRERHGTIIRDNTDIKTSLATVLDKLGKLHAFELQLTDIKTATQSILTSITTIADKVGDLDEIKTNVNSINQKIHSIEERTQRLETYLTGLAKINVDQINQLPQALQELKNFIGENHATCIGYLGRLEQSLEHVVQVLGRLPDEVAQRVRDTLSHEISGIRDEIRRLPQISDIQSIVTTDGDRTRQGLAQLQGDMNKRFNDITRMLEELKQSIRPPRQDPDNKNFQLWWVFARHKKAAQKLKDSENIPQGNDFIGVSVSLTANIHEKKQMNITEQEFKQKYALACKTRGFDPDKMYMCLGARVVGTEKPWKWDVDSIKVRAPYLYELIKRYNKHTTRTPITIAGRIIPNESFMQIVGVASPPLLGKTGKALCKTPIPGWMPRTVEVVAGLRWVASDGTQHETSQRIKLHATSGRIRTSLTYKYGGEFLFEPDVHQICAEDFDNNIIPHPHDPQNDDITKGVTLYIKAGEEVFFHRITFNQSQLGRGGYQYYSKAYHHSTRDWSENPRHTASHSGIALHFSADKEHLREEYVVVPVGRNADTERWFSGAPLTTASVAPLSEEALVLEDIDEKFRRFINSYNALDTRLEMLNDGHEAINPEETVRVTKAINALCKQIKEYIETLKARKQSFDSDENKKDMVEYIEGVIQQLERLIGEEK